MHTHHPTEPDHATFQYRSESEFVDALDRFFKRGIDSNRKCVLIETAETRASTRWDPTTHPENDTDPNEVSVCSAMETYFTEGVFDVEAVIARFEGLIDEALANGYDGICVAGDTSWVRTHDVDIDDLVAYEREVNAICETQPAEALCLYDRSSFPTEVLSATLCVHPQVTTDAEPIPNIHHERTTDQSIVMTADEDEERSTLWERMEDGGETIRTRYDWEATVPSTAVIESLEKALDRDASSLDPLYESIDPDALDTLIRSNGGPTGEGTTTVSFSIENHRVTVHSTGEVVIEAPDREDR